MFIKRTKTGKVSKAEQRRLRRLAQQFFEYMITGGVWFWSGYIIIVVLDDHIGLLAANFIGNAVGITLNFILNKYWVFKTKRKVKDNDATWRYIVYTALNAFLLNYLILLGLREKLGIDPAIGQFIASGFFTLWNFYWYKVWVFRGVVKQKRTKTHA